MKTRGSRQVGVGLLSLVGAVLGAAALGAPPDATPSAASRGDELFAAGQFEDAQVAYLAELKQRADDPHLLARLGEIALLSNRLESAEQYLRRAKPVPDDRKQVAALLAEASYRRDDFSTAASFFREAGKTAIADKLESFKGKTPYRVESPIRVTRIPFIMTDPLPVVSGRVNGGDPVNFIIDTGGGEVIIDPEYATKIGAARFGSESGTFGGDKKSDFEHGTIDSLQLGDFKIENVPVHLLSTRRFAAAAGGKQVDGIIGTVLFYHFLATLDYPNGELVLARLDRPAEPSEKGTEETAEVPFYLGGDHLILAAGRANQSPPCLMLVDTGLAGGGFTCPESTIQAAKIELPDQQLEGVGGGGTIKVTPFVMDELSLGDARRTNIPSFFGPFPASLEMGRGYRIGGLVSHAFLKTFAVTFDFQRMHIRLKMNR